MLVLLVAAASAGVYWAYVTVRSVQGWSAVVARGVCSAVFVSGRRPAEVMANDYAPFERLAVRVDEGPKYVTAGALGVERRAIFRPGLGCTSVVDTSEDELRRAPRPAEATVAPARGDLPWPEGESTETTAPALEQAVARAFAGDAPYRTRAVVVVQGGRIVAERYAAPASVSTPLPGYSMTKSITNALVGILVGRGALSVDARAPIAAWSGAADPRREITVGHLLRMTGGLDWDEGFGQPGTDSNRAMSGSRDAAAYSIDKPLRDPPGTRFVYSSGTSSILARIVLDAVGAGEDPASFPRRALFDPLGMSSAVLEVDSGGGFLGGVGAFATPRDWARFGLLYLRDGIWEGRRILPPGWVAYSRSLEAAASFGAYGAHFWTNAGGWMPRIPRDAFFAWGFGEQWVTVVPSLDAVIVRLGWDPGFGAWSQEEFLVDVLSALSPLVPLPVSGRIALRATDLRSTAGRVVCFLTASKDDWLRFAIRTTTASIHDGAATCTFDGVPPGAYAISGFHDENANGIFDFVLGFLPAEGAVFSAPVGWTGPPSFEAAQFSYDGGTRELSNPASYVF